MSTDRQTSRYAKPVFKLVHNIKDERGMSKGLVEAVIRHHEPKNPVLPQDKDKKPDGESLAHEERNVKKISNNDMASSNKGCKVRNIWQHFTFGAAKPQVTNTKYPEEMNPALMFRQFSTPATTVSALMNAQQLSNRVPNMVRPQNCFNMRGTPGNIFRFPPNMPKEAMQKYAEAMKRMQMQKNQPTETSLNLNDPMKIQTVQMKIQNEQMKTHNEQTKTQNEQVKLRKEQMTAHNEQVKTQNEQMKSQNEQVNTQNEQMKTQDEQNNTENEQTNTKNEKMTTTEKEKEPELGSNPRNQLRPIRIRKIKFRRSLAAVRDGQHGRRRCFKMAPQLVSSLAMFWPPPSYLDLNDFLTLVTYAPAYS